MADQVAEIACGVDEATLRCIWYTSTSQLRCSLVLVFGNEPDEVVADYTWENCDGALEYAVEFALEDFRTEWGRQGLSVRLSRFLNASHLLQFSALLENAKS
jgi:hypothetical protein